MLAIIPLSLAMSLVLSFFFLFFFFNDTATTEIYTLSLHDALPISIPVGIGSVGWKEKSLSGRLGSVAGNQADRKSTRLNSSHVAISYDVFCLKKKNILIDSRINLSRFVITGCTAITSDRE